VVGCYILEIIKKPIMQVLLFLFDQDRSISSQLTPDVSAGCSDSSQRPISTHPSIHAITSPALTAAGGGAMESRRRQAAIDVVAAEIVRSEPDRTMPPSAQTYEENGDGMLGGAEGAEAVEGRIRPWLLCALVKR
jgi:hypothetical protein